MVAAVSRELAQVTEITGHMIFLLEGVRQLTHAVLLVALALLCVLCLALAWHVITYLRWRRAGLATEAELLDHALPPDEDLPSVLVQVPTFNEGAVIRRMAEAISRLDWPRRKLQIQFLDDSTDESREIAREAVAALRERSFDAVLLHRKDRKGFKAAALQAGLEVSAQDYVACFDADFAPPPDFLRKCIAVLLADLGLAFVQARFDAINAEENALTRAQQRMTDVYFGILQAARSWAGHFVMFNGTCAVWRRAAIDALGGWKSDILAEDLDISCRAFLAGWRALCLVTVAVAGELPHSLASWRQQQYRWNGGLAQAMRKYLPIIWQSAAPIPRKLVFASYLGSSAFGALIGIAAVSSAVELVLGVGWSLWVLSLVGATALAFAVALVGMPLSQHLLRGRNPWADLPQEVASIAVLIGTQAAIALSFRHTLGGEGPGWTPTPKRGAALTQSTPPPAA
jgi:cellulose synthase/poly-beta-1,6-N-acetylglucosamine synthase-like glycosyltransferase